MLKFIKNLFNYRVSSKTALHKLSKYPIDLSLDVESDLPCKYLVLSWQIKQNYEHNKGNDEFTGRVGYVCFDKNYLCCSKYFAFYTEDVIPVLKEAFANTEYIITFYADSIYPEFGDLGFDEFNSKLYCLMTNSANYVGIPHPRKDEFKYPSLYELSCKLFMPDGANGVSYEKGREGEGLLYSKIFLKLIENKVINI